MVSELIADRSGLPPINSFAKLAADADVGGGNLTALDEALELVLNWVTTQFGEEQIVKAKEDFFWKMGKVFAEDEFFTQRINYFLDYFVFQRVLETQNATLYGLTPFQAYYELFGEKEPIALKDARHSLFQIAKVQDEALLIIDLLTDEKLSVSKRDFENFSGINKKDIFQGFIYAGSEGHLLSRGLIFHPPEATSLIKKFLKKAKKDKECDEQKLLSRCARQQMRHMRHRHVDARTIYAEEPA